MNIYSKIAILFLTLSTWPMITFSADWYVRPAGGVYGAENGSSYADAWDGLLNAIWGTGGVQAGDTLYVCGVHVHNMTKIDHVATQADISIVSGNSEEQRIVIRGDCPNDDQGVVWEAYKISTDVWTDKGGGVWSIPLPATQGSAWFFQDIETSPIGEEVSLDPRNSIEEVRNNPGSFYSETYGAYTPLYVQTTDGTDPTGRIYGNRWGYDFKLGGKAYITFKDLKLYAPYKLGLEEGETAPHHIRWEGCDVKYGGFLFSFRDGSDYMEVINSELSFGSVGIYNISDTNSAPSYYHYAGNYIHDISHLEKIYDADGHAIGIQGGYGGIIEDNIMENVGTGPTLYAFANQELKDTIVRRNVVLNTHTLSGSTGRGIQTACNADSLSDKTGNRFYQNIVVNATIAFRFQFEDEQYVYNNVAWNSQVGFASSRIGGNVVATNNVFTGSEYDVQWASGARGDPLIVLDHNIYSSGGGKFVFGSTEMDLTEWQQKTLAGSTFDPNSVAADPKFRNETGSFSQARDFMLSDGSPAIDAGVDVSLTEDIELNPIGSIPEIGAFSFSEGAISLPTNLQIEVVEP